MLTERGGEREKKEEKWKVVKNKACNKRIEILLNDSDKKHTKFG